MNGTLTYKPTRPFRRPLKAREPVVVRDRNLNTIGVTVVRKVARLSVLTSCGRRWRASDGRWMNGHKAFPFPSIARQPKEIGQA